jgi:hypothetical protein
MKIKDAEMAMNIIQVMYPGGLKRFCETGGGIMYVPQPVDIVLVKHDNLGEEILSKFSELPSVEVLNSNVKNFEFDEEVIEEARETVGLWMAENLSDALKNISGYQITPIANTFVLVGLKMDSPQAEKFESFLKSVPGHALSFIFYSDGNKRVESCVGISTPVHESIVLESAKPKRTVAIGGDDILNLQIALNTAESVEDFLNLV